MKMKLTLVLLLSLGVGVLARTSTLRRAQAEEAINELGERYRRSVSNESGEVTDGPSLGDSPDSNLEAMSNKAEMNGSGMSGESKSENSSGMEKKGGKSKESGEDGGQSNGGESSGVSDIEVIIKQLASSVGLDAINYLTDIYEKYYSGSLPISIEALLTTLGISTTISDITKNNSLYQLMQSIPIVGTIVQFMSNSLSIPINVIAFIFALGSTIIGHMYDSLPSIL